MNRTTTMLALVAAIVTMLSAAQAAHGDRGKPADRGHRHGDRDGLVFVQTNELDGNRVVVFERGSDGRLERDATYPTGGKGGNAAPGDASDRLASQGSLVYDGRHKLLFATNAGSDSVSVFRVQGERLRLVDVDWSGGDFPASVAVKGNLVYVLNAGNDGRLQGFRIHGNGLRPLDGSNRSLGLANTDPPNFLTSPGQVGFTPDGGKVIVTTKASKSTIEVFRVRPDGRLSRSSVSNPSATPVPFAFVFDAAGRLVAGEAGMSSVTTYAIGRDGRLSGAQSASDGQAALCWIVEARGFHYVSNTGSNTLSSFRIDAAGRPTLVNAVAAATPAGPIDMAVPSSEEFLYAQTGTAGTVEEFRVEGDGSLTRLGSVTGLPVGMEGIAAT
jgi:6-phosphogluconolactonase (cycloisomerase 2 family)